MIPGCLPAAIIAASALLLAAVLSTMDMPKRNKSPSRRSVDIFLNKMIHETCYNETKIVIFRIDCFLFDFRPYHPGGLEKQVQYGLFDYLRTLDLSQRQAIVKTYIWLKQHHVGFDFRFGWNRDLPFRYNWKQRGTQAALRKMIESIDPDALMAYDLSQDAHALRNP